MCSKIVLPISAIILTFAATCASGNSIPSNAPIHKEYVVYNSARMSFWSAWRTCHSRGQRFASVTSETDSEQLKKALEQRGLPGARYWIGATDEGSEGNWIWISTSAEIDLETGYTHWAADQPDNNRRDAENCVRVALEGGVTWTDELCSNRERFVCERDLDN